jgi:hypothetical protein
VTAANECTPRSAIAAAASTDKKRPRIGDVLDLRIRRTCNNGAFDVQFRQGFTERDA